MLLRLAAEGAGGAVERRRVALGELDDDGVAPRSSRVLAEQRLLTVSAGTVELAHEALLREWPRLRGWLEEDAEGRRVHRHLADAAREWDAGGRDAGDLYRGARLAARAGVARRATSPSSTAPSARSWTPATTPSSASARRARPPPARRGARRSRCSR